MKLVSKRDVRMLERLHRSESDICDHLFVARNMDTIYGRYKKRHARSKNHESRITNHETPMLEWSQTSRDHSREVIKAQLRNYSIYSSASEPALL